MTPEAYLMAYGLGDRQYLIRTVAPRFIADIHPPGSPRRPGNLAAGDLGTIDMEHLGVLDVCLWLDPPPLTDAAALARIARESADAILALDDETDRRIEEDEAY